VHREVLYRVIDSQQDRDLLASRLPALKQYFDIKAR
jgi:hypothetical protein